MFAATLMMCSLVFGLLMKSTVWLAVATKPLTLFTEVAQVRLARVIVIIFRVRSTFQ